MKLVKQVNGIAVIDKMIEKGPETIQNVSGQPPSLTQWATRGNHGRIYAVGVMKQCTAVLTRGYGNSLLEYCNTLFSMAEFLVGIVSRWEWGPTSPILPRTQ